MSRETGDLGGLELRFYEESGRHFVEYVLCEGWCNETIVAELQRDGDSFVFEGSVEYTDSAGGITEVGQHFRLTPRGRKFRAALVEGDYSAELGVIRPIRQPFGLAVARSEESASN
ncbi:hypothetical protein SZ64_07065 [Erythrobacter sp. SG61-1L]|nr:hypothetical protein SZ64_07065 [Erythrobacter sp. SG61-1L]